MAHRYGELVRGDAEATGRRDSMLRSFTWRGVRYPVVTVLSSWRLVAYWRDPERHADRCYYRVETPGHSIFELYEDQVRGVWVLDVVQD